MSRLLVFGMSVFLCGCGAGLPTLPQDHQPAKADVILSHDNHWEVWSNSFSGCGRYVSGNFDVHLVSHSVGVDGVWRNRSTLNVPRGRLYDTDGNEYRFQEISHGEVYSPDGYDQVNLYRYRFQIISPGPAANQVIEISLSIIWDSGNLEVTSVYVSECRG